MQAITKWLVNDEEAVFWNVLNDLHRHCEKCTGNGNKMEITKYIDLQYSLLL